MSPLGAPYPRPVAAIVSVVTFALYFLLSYFTSLPMFAVFGIVIPLFLLALLKNKL